MATKALPAEENEYLRRLVQAVVDDRFGGNVTHAAKAIGLSQPTLQAFLRRNRGAGAPFLKAVASYLQVPIDALFEGTSSVHASAQVVRPNRELESVLAAASWPEAVKSALRAVSDRDFAPAIWQRLGDDFARALRYAEIEQRSAPAVATPTSIARPR